MTAHAYAGNTTRPHWGGADSNVEQHLEVYDGEVDTAFQYKALFLSLSAQRSVNDRSNTIRIDRLNKSTVKSRQSGEALDSQKVTSDKLTITVDTVLYIRNPIDYQDDWTAPDFLREMGMNNGTSFAEAFDEAHIIQLIKSRDWVAPAHLKPAFQDGIEIECEFDATANLTQAEQEANAVALNTAHKAAVQELIERKVPLTDMVTLVTPDVYSAIIEHPKLLKVEEYGGSDNGAYADRRVVRLNGVAIVECTEFPKAVNNAHILGDDFNTTTADIACGMVLFSASRALVTVEAKPFTSRFWDDAREFCNVLDCYAMYTVGQRRPDTTAVIKLVDPV